MEDTIQFYCIVAGPLRHTSTKICLQLRMYIYANYKILITRVSDLYCIILLSSTVNVIKNAIV
jgi:hypothetical protein